MRARDRWQDEKYRLIAQMVSFRPGGICFGCAEMFQLKDLGAKKEYTAEQCETQLKTMEKQSQEQAHESSTGPSQSLRPRKRPRGTMPVSAGA